MTHAWPAIIIQSISFGFGNNGKNPGTSLAHQRADYNIPFSVSYLAYLLAPSFSPVLSLYLFLYGCLSVCLSFSPPPPPPLSLSLSLSLCLPLSQHFPPRCTPFSNAYCDVCPDGTFFDRTTNSCLPCDVCSESKTQACPVEIQRTCGETQTAPTLTSITVSPSAIQRKSCSKNSTPVTIKFCPETPSCFGHMKKFIRHKSGGMLSYAQKYLWPLH